MSFERTKQALGVWAMTEPARQKAWDGVESDFDVVVCESDDDLARLRVCAAFYRDTKHINSWNNCKLLTIRDIKRMVR